MGITQRGLAVIARRMRTAPAWMLPTMKRIVMWLYCHGLIPSGAVTWLFDHLRLRNE